MIQKPRKWEDILTFSAILLGAVLVNLNAGLLPLRLDLTEEKRYTITGATKNLLKNLDDVVYVEVYLEGDLNAGFRRLQKSVRETLEEFRVYAGQRVAYKFTDPADAPNEGARNRFYQQLAQKGLPPTTLYDNADGKQVQKVIFPGAIISYRNREMPVLLLKGNKAASPQEQLNQSVEGVEYELASAIQKLAVREKKSIAFVQGHDELPREQVQDMTTALSETYLVDFIELDHPDLDRYEALIVAQPKQPFTEQEKYAIDQYIMRGGSGLFLIDKVQMNLDSIALGGTYAFGYELNIEDMLFRYGARPNMNLVQDLQAGSIEVVTGNFGNRPNMNRLRWPYYVFLNNYSKHPVVRNLDVTYSKFVSTVDTVKAEGITKTPLIFTSQYSRVKDAPGMVDLNELKQDLNPELYTQPFMPVAWLLEGSFKSLFANRYAPAGMRNGEKIDQGEPSKIIVVGDGDIIRNEFDRETGRPLPIDFDRSSRQALSNKEFITNAIAWLVDENGLIASRKREVALRPLDTFRVNEEKLYWQLLNIVLPVVLVILFGIAWFWRRKKKYSGFNVVPANQPAEAAPASLQDGETVK